MSLSPLVPFFTGLTLTGVMLIGAREHHLKVGNAEIYKFPAALGYMMFGIAVLFLGAPFLPGAKGDMDFLTFASFFWIIAALVVAFGFYLLKYRVVINDGHLSAGAYFKRQIDLRDIVAANLKRGSRSAELTLSIRAGRKILLSGMLADFDSLAQTMISCAAKNQQS
ncbi:hypothetical protein [Rhodanobacter sp. DHG33]|uniref:hypothetical protein n=1 Tax=Rhodanobacter sp. DHG33 TaxID=2775921 RepID=UPI001783628B|nr:hypothetical protein [Rhodanobacter sp. DHG33]MBD8897627.1 hypothetical protein [Rhodanobacter sp. DHG33]